MMQGPRCPSVRAVLWRACSPGLGRGRIAPQPQPKPLAASEFGVGPLLGGVGRISPVWIAPCRHRGMGWGRVALMTLTRTA